MQLPLYTPPGIPAIMVTSEVVTVDVPALLGLNVLDILQVTVDRAFILLEKRTSIVNDDTSVVYVDEWSVPLHQDSSKHVFAQTGHRTAVGELFTRSQLIRLRRHVFIHLLKHDSTFFEKFVPKKQHHKKAVCMTLQTDVILVNAFRMPRIAFSSQLELWWQGVMKALLLIL